MTTNSHQYKCHPGPNHHISETPLSFSHTLVLHQWGPLASDSPQWNFHAAIWRSIGERDLLSGLDVPVEKTRKLEHIGFCKSEGKEKSSWILPLLLLTIWSFSIGKKSLCLCTSVGICICIVWHLCQSSAKQVLQKNSGGVDPYSLPWYYEGNGGNGAFKLTTNFRKTTHCKGKGHCYCKTTLQWC